MCCMWLIVRASVAHMRTEYNAQIVFCSRVLKHMYDILQYPRCS